MINHVPKQSCDEYGMEFESQLTLKSSMQYAIVYPNSNFQVSSIYILLAAIFMIGVSGLTLKCTRHRTTVVIVSKYTGNIVAYS